MTHFEESLFAVTLILASGCGGSVSTASNSQHVNDGNPQVPTTPSGPLTPTPSADSGTTLVTPPIPPTTTVPPSMTSPPSTATVPTAPAPHALDASYVLADAAPACAASEDPIFAPMTEADVRSWLVRAWVLCGSTSVFGTNGDVGVDISADGSWRKLRGGAGGELIFGSEPDDRGTWSLIDVSDMNVPGTFQVNFDTPTGTVIVLPEFASSPAKMHVDNMGVYSATYVAFGEAAPPPVPPFVEPMTLPANACSGPPQGAVGASDQSDFNRLVVGKWSSCGGTLFPGSDDVGIELDASGVWYKLYPGSAPGTVVRGRGFDHEGTWRGLDTSGTNGPKSFQLDLKISGSGTMPVTPSFFDAPRSMACGYAGVTFAAAE